MKMKKIGKLLITVILLFSITIPVYANSINDAKGDKKDLEDKKNATQKEINTLEGQKSNTKAAIEELDKKLLKLDEKISTLKSDLKATQEELKTTQRELKEAKKKEKEQYQTMKTRIKFMYENGETAYIDAIFQASSFSDLLNRAEYVSKISEYDHNMLKRLEETRKQIAKTEKKLETEVAKVEQLKADVEKEQAGVETLVAEKNKEVKKYEADIKKNQSMVADYEKSIQEQENLIAKLEKEARDKAAAEKAKADAEKAKNQNQNQNGGGSSSPSTPVYTGGKFAWPVPASSTITSYFGYRNHPVTGGNKLHEGIDISAPSGTAVVAAADGTVILSDYNSTAGNWIMIDHGNGLTTVYMHNSSLLVRTGAKVSRGQHIANVGSTGTSTGAHLHFGVRSNGSYVDPMSYLR